jgi:hypothetical protein
MFRVVVAVLFLGISTLQAGAATYRYSFDIVDSEIGYFDEIKHDGSNYPYDNLLPWYLGERESYIRTYHSIGHLYGVTGRVVMDIKGPRSTPYDRSEDPVSCVSGDFCLPWGDSVWVNDLFVSFGNGFYMTFENPELGLETSLRFGGGPHSLQFSCVSPQYPNCQIEFWLETGSFTIANFSRTQINAAPPAPVPLPATAWLLGLGLFALGMKARRRAT